MIILKDMRDSSKRDILLFECNKDIDYTFATITRLIKAIYSEVRKANLFNPRYNVIRVVLFEAFFKTNEELMR